MLSTQWAQIIYVITLQLSIVFILFLGSFILGLFQQVLKMSTSTLNTRCGALHHVGHGTPDFLGSRLSQKSVENCLEGSDGQNLPGVTVNAKMLRKLPPDL